MRRLDTTTDDVLGFLAKRTIWADAETERIVQGIIEDVRRRGDLALLENGRRFDSPELHSLTVSGEEMKRHAEALPQRVSLAFETTTARVTDFHRNQLKHLTLGFESPGGGVWQWRSEGGQLGQRLIPLSTVGVYVPGGNASYPSSVFMNAIPALVAGVRNVSVATPVRPDGSILPAVSAAMSLVGINRAYKMGGAAAIAAFALGTESVSRVDKVVGPGNRYVNEAKRQLWGRVGLDGYAGPSEVCVLADDAANSEFAAADLLTQVEHAPDNAGFLITISRAKQEEILAEVERQLTGAPKEAIMREALAREGLAIVARDVEEAIDLVNALAPEHVTVAVTQPERVGAQIVNAGCVLLGEYTPESAGDYVLGPSHTLPTSGAARWQSPVNVLDFLKVQSVSHLKPCDLAPLVEAIETFGEIEGFPAHAFGATVRR